MAITRVQFKSNTGSGVTSLAITPDSTPTDGNLQVLMIAYNSATASRVSSISQVGGAWTRAIQKNNTLGGAISVDCWYSPNVSDVEATVTINLASSLNVAATYLEYSGLATSSVVDKTASAEEFVDGAG